MNLGSNLGSLFSLAPAGSPWEPPAISVEQLSERPAGDDAALEEAKQREEAFDKALRDELARRRPTGLPLFAPWFGAQNVVSTEGERTAIDASAAAGETAGAGARAFAAWMAQGAVKGTGRAEDLGVAPAEPEEKPGPETVQVLVEPGLPPVQPESPEPTRHVPLAQFPQVVTGEVQKLVANNQPVTRLDFHITPPHVGPVNLQLTLQNGAVNVQLVALTLHAKQALESQVGAIQQILQAHKLAPGEVKVVTAAAGKSGAGAAGGRGDQPGSFGFAHGGRRRANPEGELKVSV